MIVINSSDELAQIELDKIDGIMFEDVEDIEVVPALPDNIVSLGVKNCPNLTSFTKLPDTLQTLLVVDCPCISFLYIPLSVKDVNIIDCKKLEWISDLGEKLVSLAVINCPITKLDNIPTSCQFLTLTNLALEKAPKLPPSCLFIGANYEKQPEKEIKQKRKKRNRMMCEEEEQVVKKICFDDCIDYGFQYELQAVNSIKNISDLIELSKSIYYHKNIDMIALWKIRPYLEELEAMVGLKSLKESIFLQVLYYLQNMHKKSNEEYLHTVIYGNPGCGKTTVAHIIGKIYQKLGILSDYSDVKVAGKEDFVAGYLGQTVIKTKKLLNSCIGGVLFIDEVYGLAPKNSDRDSFSKEAIDTLNRFLSEHKNDFCCIIAGYEDEVNECFFNMNKGLERRFPWIHRMEEYSGLELSEIFRSMVEKVDWKLDFSPSFMVNIIRENKSMFKYNAGSIETFLSKCKILHSRRVFGSDAESKYILTKEDILNSVEYMKSNGYKEDVPPEGMYV